jgi:hypothetical protein
VVGDGPVDELAVWLRARAREVVRGEQGRRGQRPGARFEYVNCPPTVGLLPHAPTLLQVR